MSRQDRHYVDLHADIEAFQFDAEVADVFADMIRRSVPGYATVIAMTGVLAGEYGKRDTRIYDLGCSLGASLIACSRYAPRQATLIGVDNSQAMLDRCQAQLLDLEQAAELKCEDIAQSMIENASMVIMNYTLQFVPLEQRLALLKRIYQGLNKGGILLLSEKLHFAQAPMQQSMTELYYAFKRENGYSELEISQKRTALENVLITQTEAEHTNSLQQAGFDAVYPWFQCLNFKSFVAVKG